MKKRITNETQNSLVTRPKKRVALATSSIISLGSGASMVIFGYSHLLLLVLLGSLAFSIGNFLYHYIKSEAYLSPVKEKTIRQKLLTLKFRLSDDQYQPIIEAAITAESKISKNRELLEKVLLKFFSPEELTYQRYYNTGNQALNAITTNLDSIIDRLNTLKQFDNEDNKTQLLQKIEADLKEIHVLFDSFESLIMSFDACEQRPDRHEVFAQLEELAKRTEKYFNI